jgi:hypothetical protein
METIVESKKQNKQMYTIIVPAFVGPCDVKAIIRNTRKQQHPMAIPYTSNMTPTAFPNPFRESDIDV